jgi:hypothetical protein
MPQKWFETSPGWDLLVAHVGACTKTACGCVRFKRNFGDWSQKTKLHDDQDGDSSSWLWFTFTSQGNFRWHCIVCGDSNAEIESGRGMPLAADATQSVQISNLLTHHNSSTHLENLGKMFPQFATNDLYTVPPKQLWIDLLKAFQNSETPSHGFDLPSGRISFAKADQMLWTLNEARGDVKRDILRNAEVISVLRDERHGRMHVRARCTDEKTDAFYLGQSRGHNPDALGLTEATVNVVRAVCTERANPPKGAVVEPHFDKKLFVDTKNKVEGVSIDSAENEVVSARDMSTRKPDGSAPEFPNAAHTLRDAAHSARRILGRLWKADSVLDYTYKFFMMIASIIQWSLDLRQLYQECTQESADKAVYTEFQHMRAAKHRIETFLTPISRCILDPSGEHFIFKHIRVGNHCGTPQTYV